MDIGSNNNTLNINDVLTSLLSEEMQWKNMDGSNNEALIVRHQ